ncbi:MAG: M20/M25/M40 family metallo-hydrolase [Terriglobales bacterium]
MYRKFYIVTALLCAGLTAVAQAPVDSTAAEAANPNAACRACVEAHEDFLASDALQGRGSGTRNELLAATYIASELGAYGIAPAGDQGGYLETAPGLPKGSPRWRQASANLGTTANVIGVLRGSDASAKVLLLTAHLDHLGIIPSRPYKGDDLYNGADDDASGCTAVLELARMLALGPRPRRTVYFAFFGSEEDGGFGARYFVQHPPVPLTDMFANIEFEMIGWPDAAVPAHTLWLTGWQRSNLGPHLASEGARLVGDPHPDQHFFCRSDNIQVAYAGVVAQTVSSFGMQPMYHRPDDDLAHLDVGLMTASISSMIQPVRNLLNSNFVPAWKPGGQPRQGEKCY